MKIMALIIIKTIIEMETIIIEMEIDELAPPNSRLGCQITIQEGMESITARIANLSNF